VYRYALNNPLVYRDIYGLYVPSATEHCWVRFLSDVTSPTGISHTNLGNEYTFDVTVPLPLSSPWGKAPDMVAYIMITYHSQFYSIVDLYKRDRSYLYICEKEGECGNKTYDEVLGFDTQKWWKERETGTYRWVTKDTFVTNPQPIPDPNDPDGPIAPMPPPPPPVWALAL
jgi:hypothetical protein